MRDLSRLRRLYASAAFVALLVGVGFYCVARQPESVYFLTLWGVQGSNVDLSLGVLGNHLPTFLHVYAFIMLTLVVIAPSRVYAIAICAAWFVVDSLFELGQIAVVAKEIANYVPEWFREIPFLENTTDYFLHGTFDVIDLYSIAFGSVAAFLTYLSNALRLHKGGSNA